MASRCPCWRRRLAGWWRLRKRRHWTQPQFRINHLYRSAGSGVVSLGLGGQWTTHSSGQDDITITGLFVEPRWVPPLPFERVSLRRGVCGSTQSIQQLRNVLNGCRVRRGWGRRVCGKSTAERGCGRRTGTTVVRRILNSRAAGRPALGPSIRSPRTRRKWFSLGRRDDRCERHASGPRAASARIATSSVEQSRCKSSRAHGRPSMRRSASSHSAALAAQ